MFRSKSEDYLDVDKSGANKNNKKTNFIRKFFNVRQASHQQLQNNRCNSHSKHVTTTLLLQQQQQNIPSPTSPPTLHHRNSVEVLRDQPINNHVLDHGVHGRSDDKQKRKNFFAKLFGKKLKISKIDHLQSDDNFSSSQLSTKQLTTPPLSTTNKIMNDASTQWSPLTPNNGDVNDSNDDNGDDDNDADNALIENNKFITDEAKAISFDKVELVDNFTGADDDDDGDDDGWMEKIKTETPPLPETEIDKADDKGDSSQSHLITADEFEITKDDFRLNKEPATTFHGSDRSGGHGHRERQSESFFVSLDNDCDNRNDDDVVLLRNGESNKDFKIENLTLENKQNHPKERNVKELIDSTCFQSTSGFLGNRTPQSRQHSDKTNLNGNNDIPTSLNSSASITTSFPPSSTSITSDTFLSCKSTKHQHTYTPQNDRYDDRIKKLIEAKKKTRVRNKETSGWVSYFYDIDQLESNVDRQDSTKPSVDDKIKDKLFMHCSADELSINNSSIYSIENSRKVSSSNTRAKSKIHSTSSESDSGSCNSYYINCKQFSSLEPLDAILPSSSPIQWTLPDILENASSIGEESNPLTRDILSFEHLSLTMNHSSSEDNGVKEEEELFKLDLNSGTDKLSNHYKECFISNLTLTKSDSLTSNKFNHEDNSSKKCDFHFKHASLPSINTPSVTFKTNSNNLSDLSSVRRKLFGKDNSDLCLTQIIQKNTLSRSLSDRPNADQNTANIHQSRLTYLHNYSRDLAQQTATRHRYKSNISKVDSLSSQDSHEDAVNGSLLTGSLDRLSSQVYHSNIIGLAKRRNYRGPKLLHSDDHDHHHSMVNSDSPSSESYFKSAKPHPLPIPKVALAKLNDDGTPKSILKNVRQIPELNGVS